VDTLNKDNIIEHINNYLHYCCGFVNRSTTGVGVWRFVEGGEHGGAIRDGGSMSLPSFRSRNGGENLRAAIIHYMATSARLQWIGWLFRYAIGRMSKLLPQGLPHAGLKRRLVWATWWYRSGYNLES
jgi:hypothetical protein